MFAAWAVRTFGLTVDTAQHQNPHRLRREEIAKRVRLYRDEGAVDLSRVIDDVYDTEEYRAILKRYVKIAMGQNVTRRIVDEVASLYDKPALRSLADEEKSAALHLEESRLRLHEIMQEAQHLLMLCNEVLVWQFTGADDKKRLRLVTSDMFDAIPNPRDPLQEAGLLIDAAPQTVLQGEAAWALPHWEIWDDTYRYQISKRGHLVDDAGTPVAKPLEHGLGRIPAVLLHRREPTTAILDASRGSDIGSAHLGVAMLNVMIMRLSKAQGENQPVLQGNLASMATGQLRDGERPLVLPPEVVASMLQMKTDPDHYLRVKKDMLASVAQTYGMSYEQFTMGESSDTASGKVYALRREKLTEIRLEQRRRAVMHEAQVVSLIGFDSDELKTDFQEQAIPSDPNEEVGLLRDKMKLGLDSPVSYLMRKDPDLSRTDALDVLSANLRDYAVLIQLVRALNMPADGDADNPGQTPQDNGSDNHAQSIERL